jgi:hypothetical protein
MRTKALKISGLLMLIVFSFTMMSFADASARRPFWGNGSAPDGACGPNSNGDGGCSYGTYTQHYIFWIADGEPQWTGNTYPCPCP